MKEDYELMFFETGSKNVFTPINARYLSGERVRGDRITDALKGALVDVAFTLHHYPMNKSDSGPHDAYSGDMIVILHRAPNLTHPSVDRTSSHIG